MAVNLSFIGGAGWQFFDNNGNVLSGGLLYTYAAGTTTPQTTYTSRSGTIANTNPIILDSAGRTPEQIWSTEGLLYKYVIADSSNVVIRTWDNIGGSVVASDLAQDLANSSNPAKGDALVGFRQSNSSGNLTNSVGSTVHNKLQESVSVKDFGAVGDGIADDTAAIQAAINATTAIYIPQGIYKVTGTITLKSNLSIIMDKTTVIDFSTAGAVPCFYATGTVASSLLLTSNATENSSTVVLANTSSLAIGDMLRLSADTVFDPARTSTRIAELVYVSALTLTDITTTTPIQDTYTTVDIAKIEKITPIENVYIYGGKIVGSSTANSGDFGVQVIYGSNIIVENVYFYDIDFAMIQFNNCVGAWARNCRFERAQSNTAYGVSFANTTRDSGCVNSTFLQVRHSLSTNSTSGANGGIVRRILFSNNIVYQSALNLSSGGSDAVDTHAAAENIGIINNKVFASTSNGINVECASAQIIGNEIVNANSNGILCRNYTLKKGEYEISNNKIIQTGLSAIRVQTIASSEIIDSLTVSSNNIRNANEYGIYVLGLSAVNIENTTLSGNTIVDASGSLGSILTTFANRTAIANNSIVAVNAGGIRVQNGKHISITGNVIRLPSSATGSAVALIAANPNDLEVVSVSGNVAHAPSPTSSTGINVGVGVRGLTISANSFQECTTPISSPSYTIVSDAITIVGDVGAIRVDTEGGAATDNLATISGGVERQMLIVRTVSSARDVALKDGTGNLRLAGDCTLSNTNDVISLMYIGTEWFEVSRSLNGA